jgi:hypothetical protein
MATTTNEFGETWLWDDTMTEPVLIETGEPIDEDRLVLVDDIPF